MGGITRLLLRLGILSVALGAACVPGGQTGGNDITGYADQVFDLVNSRRTANGLAPLVRDDLLTQASQAYAERMADLDFFSHRDPENGQMPGDRATAAGYAWSAIQENLAAGAATPQQIVDAWMNDSVHRANILSPLVTETGVGVAEDGSQGIYWVQMFASPL
jgi:uncharacterized protein YkwD